MSGMGRRGRETKERKDLKRKYKQLDLITVPQEKKKPTF